MEILRCRNEEDLEMQFNKEAASQNQVDKIDSQPYKYGFFTDIETEKISKGLNEDVIRLISKKKKEPQFLLDFRKLSQKDYLEN